MPLILNRIIDKNTLLGLWKIDEEAENLRKQAELDNTEELAYTSFKSEIRKKQWLSYRILLKKMLYPQSVTLEYDAYGKPFLKNNAHFISISHSGDYSSVIISKSDPVGIDIERLKERIHRIKDRFLTTGEDQMIGNSNRLEKLYIAWGAKEAVYKIHGRPDVDFQHDIRILTIDYLCTEKGNCTAVMNASGIQEEFTVTYERIEDYMLVYALKKM